MAGDDPSEREIVHVYHDPEAATCEGRIVVCRDGSRWREVEPFSLSVLGTGQTRGAIRDNKVVHM